MLLLAMGNKSEDDRGLRLRFYVRRKTGAHEVWEKVFGVEWASMGPRQVCNGCWRKLITLAWQNVW